MSEVKNKGLEVVATFDGLYLVPLAIMDAGTDLCLHSEALAGYAVRDARIAELEGKNARLTAGVDSDMADIDRMQLLYDAEFRKCRQLRAELAALTAKLDASKFCANVADDLRAELAAIRAQEPIGWYTDDHLTDKSATTYDWGVAERWDTKGWPLFPLYAAPVAKEVVVPDALSRAFITCESFSDSYRVIIQTKTLEETQDVHSWIARLNAADQEGGV